MCNAFTVYAKTRVIASLHPVTRKCGGNMAGKAHLLTSHFIHSIEERIYYVECFACVSGLLKI